MWFFCGVVASLDNRRQSDASYGAAASLESSW